MAESDSKVSSLVDEGLQLYSQGELDEAISRWRAVLKLVPDHPRAREYIKYVDENRTALEQSFLLASEAQVPTEAPPARESLLSTSTPAQAAKKTGWLEPGKAEPDTLKGLAESYRPLTLEQLTPVSPKTPSGWREPGKAQVTEKDHGRTSHRESLGNLLASALTQKGEIHNSLAAAGEPLEQEFSFHLEHEPDEAAASERVTPHNMTQSVTEEAPGEIEVTARMSKDVLQANIDTMRTPTPDSQGRSIATPASLLPRVTPIETPPAGAPSFVVMQGGGEDAEEENFDPDERTPVGIRLPKPARLVDEQRTSDIVPQVDQGEGQAPMIDAMDLLNQPTPTVGLGEEDDDRVESMFAGALQLYEQGTFESSLWLCERILSTEPEHELAKQLLEKNRTVLLEQYRKQIGDPTLVPVVQIPQQEILWHKLDHRAGFLLSRIDGQLTYEDIIDVSGMNAFESSRILAQLLSLSVIGPKK